MLVYISSGLGSPCKTVFNQRLICKKILKVLGSYGDLGDCGKNSFSRGYLFHGINKGQETSMENKRIRFVEISDGELKCWLTIQYKATREKSIKCAATIFVRSL